MPRSACEGVFEDLDELALGWLGLWHRGRVLGCVTCVQACEVGVGVVASDV